jgi:hypothetical protein
MNKSLSRTISSLALAGLAGAFVSIAEPAEARKTQCQIKYTSCNNRCVGAYNDPIPCIHRTCDRQYDNCAAAEDKGGGKGGKGGRAGFGANTKQSGPVASGPYSPRGPMSPGPFAPGGMKSKQSGASGSGAPSRQPGFGRR